MLSLHSTTIATPNLKKSKIKMKNSILDKVILLLIVSLLFAASAPIEQDTEEDADQSYEDFKKHYREDFYNHDADSHVEYLCFKP